MASGACVVGKFLKRLDKYQSGVAWGGGKLILVWDKHEDALNDLL